MLRSIKTLLLITLLGAAIFGCRYTYQMVSGEYVNFEVSPESVQPDSQIVRIYWPYKQELDSGMNVVIGFSTSAMVKGKPESKLTNYLADLLLEETSLILREINAGIVPDISFLNYGGIRTGLPEGEVLVRKIFELMPFDNELVVLQLTGKNIQAFLNLIASQGGDSMSGARFRIRDNKAAEITVGGLPLDPDRLYWLATSDYVADGGDSFSMLQKNVQRINTNVKIRDVMIRNMQKAYLAGDLINPGLDGRIIHE